jgi:DNA-binding NarL/FixJ family response regulator
MAKPLTQREREVLKHVAGGLTLMQVAGVLKIQRSTVHSHVKSIYSKHGISSRAEAALLASQLGLLQK